MLIFCDRVSVQSLWAPQKNSCGDAPRKRCVAFCSSGSAPASRTRSVQGGSLWRQKRCLENGVRRSYGSGRGIDTPCKWRVRAQDYDALPFDAAQYRRVFLQFIVQSSAYETASGTIVLMENQMSKLELSQLEGTSLHALPLQVGGDTLTAISFLAAGRESHRPMTLNLLLQVLERCRQCNKAEWELLWVAIVDFRDSIYIGRLYFGNPVTREIAWDCDCRPSDACWLSLKTDCPLYVHENVWGECASPLNMALGAGAEEPEGMINVSEAEEDPMTAILPGDPEVIRRLKREMAVAIAEEDYKTAARLRDHPYMQKYKRIQEHRAAGEHSEAAELQLALEKDVEENEQLGDTEKD
ncbi:hypothetical protein BSKO_13184 [Bryopsis sp. KO-2023]|nr:hypothetical protein BSKO_13184 [Bryopsis sp. KO-2023]